MDNAEDLDVVMAIDNLLKYSDNYSMTWGSLWSYYRDEVIDSANEMDDNNKINSKKKPTSKSFEFKAKIIGSTAANDNSRLHQIIIVD